jgi:transposase-like protein
MVRPGRERLSGFVEVDETYVGGRDLRPRRTPRKTKQRRPPPVASKKSVVLIAAEMVDPKGFGRIRLRRVPAATATHALPFVRDSIEPGTVVRTDGSAIYRSIEQYGYVREKTVLLGSADPAHVSMPAVHRIAALLKRWLLGTHQGAVNGAQLDAYLDEFAFRFNLRSSRSRGLLFYRLLEQAAATPPSDLRRCRRQTQKHKT